MLKPLAIRNQLWRLCTNFTSYRSRPGGTQGLQIPGAEFDSLAICHNGRWSSWLGRPTANRKVAGSNPALPSKRRVSSGGER